jgi:hypothetical protein
MGTKKNGQAREQAREHDGDGIKKTKEGRYGFKA